MTRCTRSALASLAVLGALASLPASAHIGYTGRDFGSFTGTHKASMTIANQAVTSNYGWADATDADFGDSHRGRAFRFHLDRNAWVDIDVAAKADATTTSIGGLLPGFSVYQGLAHVAPDAADHDGAAISQAWLASLGGAPKEGAWRSLADWKIGSDTGTTFADLSSFAFKGYAVDGTARDYGTAAVIGGDGIADGRTRGSFLLGAGDYTIFVGGARYAAQDLSNPDLLKSYGMSVTVAVSAVPEPGSAALLLAGLVPFAAARVRRRATPR